MNGRMLDRGSRLAAGIEISVMIVFALFVGVLIVRSATAAIAFAAAVILFLSVSRSPLRALSLLVFFIPFSMTTLFNEPVAEFPGSRPFLLLGVFVSLIAFLNWRSGVRIPSRVVLLAVFIVVLLLISVLRSLPKMGVLGAALDQDYTVSGFILSYFVKPLVYIIPMIVISRFVKDRKDVNKITSVLVLSVIALSVYFLYYYTFNVKDKGNIDEAWETVGDALGLWKGSAGFLYVIGFPMVLARYFVKKDLISIVGIILCVISVAFLYSRTAYVTVAAAFFLFMFFSKRSRFFPVVIVLAIGASFVISDSVMERATKGLQDRDLNQVTSGRVEHQWIPLIEEYLKTPGDLIVGRGRFSVVTTRVWQSGILPGAVHPHNMFLEMILDAGFLGLLPLLTIIAGFLWEAYRWIPRIRDRVLREYLCGALVAIICDLMGGMTTGSMFPQLENSYFWFVAALIFVIVRVHLSSMQEPSAPHSEALVPVPEPASNR